MTVRVDRTTVESSIQTATHRQQRIANRFSLQATRRHMMQQPVPRIRRQRPLCRPTRLAERATENHSADQLLAGPPRYHKLTGQVVQQFRMRRAIAKASKIVRSPDQPDTEYPLPKPVHMHPSCQGMPIVDQKSRQLESTASRTVRLGRGLGLCKYLQKPPRHFRAAIVDAASNVQRIVDPHHRSFVHAVDRPGKRHCRLRLAITLEQSCQLGLGHRRVLEQSVL